MRRASITALLLLAGMARNDVERVLRAAAAKYAEAAVFYEQAVAADPNDVEVALSYAEALMQDQIGALAQSTDTTADDVTRFRKARALLQRALEHRADPAFPLGRAVGDLGTTYSAEDDITPGVVPLEQASALLPGRTDFALHLLAMYRRLGDGAKADPLFARLDAAHQTQLSFAARAVIVRADLARANAFTHEQRLDEAAAVIRDLAANSADPAARRGLETQAAELTRIAAQNRQIDAYNQIIAQVNNGNYHDATKALKELLTTAGRRHRARREETAEAAGSVPTVAPGTRASRPPDLAESCRTAGGTPAFPGECRTLLPRIRSRDARV
jgi:tetratricopeptide (TPR) repeat protein